LKKKALILSTRTIAKHNCKDEKHQGCFPRFHLTSAYFSINCSLKAFITESARPFLYDMDVAPPHCGMDAAVVAVSWWRLHTFMRKVSHMNVVARGHDMDVAPTQLSHCLSDGSSGVVFICPYAGTFHPSA
jgi:hypothetical protein